MQAIAKELGGSFKQNPLWWSKRVITVHPLGGAPAGRNRGKPCAIRTARSSDTRD